MAGGHLRAYCAADDHGARLSSSAARSTTSSATRRSPASRIVSGDRHSFWAGYAAAKLPPGKFEPVGSELRRRLAGQPGRDGRPTSTASRRTGPLRPLYLADRPDGTLRVDVQHAAEARRPVGLEYAKSFDLAKAQAAVQPGARAAPRIRRHGRSRLCDGAADRRRDADRVRLHPAADHAQRAPRRRAAALSRRAHRASCGGQASGRSSSSR